MLSTSLIFLLLPLHRFPFLFFSNSPGDVWTVLLSVEGARRRRGFYFKSQFIISSASFLFPFSSLSSRVFLSFVDPFLRLFLLLPSKFSLTLSFFYSSIIAVPLLSCSVFSFIFLSFSFVHFFHLVRTFKSFFNSLSPPPTIFLPNPPLAYFLEHISFLRSHNVSVFIVSYFSLYVPTSFSTLCFVFFL